MVDGIVAGCSTLTWKRSCTSVAVSETSAPQRWQTTVLAGSAVASR
jgi:predicted secreted protein